MIYAKSKLKNELKLWIWILKLKAIVMGKLEDTLSLIFEAKEKKFGTLS